MTKIQIPDDLEQRITELEEKADEKLPGDYTIETNFFTDGDAHLVAVHNFSEQHSLRLHEDAKDPRRCGEIIIGGVKVPARMGEVLYKSED